MRKFRRCASRVCRVCFHLGALLVIVKVFSEGELSWWGERGAQSVVVESLMTEFLPGRE